VTVIILASAIGAVMFIRKRHQRRRAERRTLWAPVMVTNPAGNNVSTMRSARSSFATNFDIGIPPPSPVASVPPFPHSPSMKHLSDPQDGQWLFVDQGYRDGPVTPSIPSPLSVRPFSPTESYKFPRPPGSDRGSRSSRHLLSSVGDTGAAPGVSSNRAQSQPLSNVGLNTVKRTFMPTRGDELQIIVGDVVLVETAFDDGWALASTLDGVKGLVTLACFEDDTLLTHHNGS